MRDLMLMRAMCRFAGNAHLIYSGFFFYNQEATNKLIKYDMNNNHSFFRAIDGASHSQDASPRTLYETQHNYMDIAADENGLWVRVMQREKLHR